MGRTLLVDGDIYVHAACFASEYDVEWQDDMWVRLGDLARAKNHFARSMARLLKELEADNLLVALSCVMGRWRERVYNLYKSKRSGRKPVHYRPLREWIHKIYPTHEKPTLEGDDVLGILATHPGLHEHERVIVSPDKDMQTVPGWLCNPDKGYTQTLITPFEADYAHMFQTLTGDQTDGYRGIPGVGPVKAKKVLKDLALNGEMWEAVLGAYAKADLDADEALMNARLARICRFEDWDAEKQQVILWEPPTSA